MNAVPTSPPPPTLSNVAQPSTGPSRPKQSAEPHATTFTSSADAATPILTCRHSSPVQSPYVLDVTLASFSVLAVCLDIAMVIIKPNLPFQSRFRQVISLPHIFIRALYRFFPILIYHMMLNLFSKCASAVPTGCRHCWHYTKGKN